MSVKFVGVDEVLKNLRNEFKKMEIRLSRRGLVQVGELVRRESIKLTPVDTGNLRSSSFVRPFKRQGRPSVVIGYAAAYAAMVHERTHSKSGTKIQYGSPRAESKFLEKALFRNQKKILAILAAAARFK